MLCVRTQSIDCLPWNMFSVAMKRITACCCLLCALWTECMCLKVEGTEREHVTFNCPHQNAYGNRKYFCNRTCKGKDVLATVEPFKSMTAGRIHLKESSGVLEVTITNLEVSDTGKFWCGVERLGVDTYIDVNLRVKEAPLQTTVAPTTSPTPSPDVSTTWTYAPTTTTTETTAPDDPASHWPTDALLYAALGAAGLIFFVGLFICVRKRRTKPQAADPGRADLTSSSENDYDDIGVVLHPVAHVSSGITRHHDKCRSAYTLASWGKNTYLVDRACKSSSSSVPSSTLKRRPESVPPPIVPRAPADDYANIPSTPANAKRPRYSHRSKVSTWDSKDLRVTPVGVGRREKS